ncbi:hypothetical protein GRI62_09605 [Erythrobacter arachoides]|uniref:HTH luxR-type domain-containing protein n=1 Tax=Aurantiacibacter arachoides TaxID=1850444 RepID=A0A845A082_9SPHN|nr:LuxR C-terminal-related transcriptional regulator [Aurantiacibacter arachoides]MXO93863.1 hypothetical protein [Aurantiacibacter arachoides]GGD46122.1 hypothetical protein GCM10011411_02180 [Aurantiacibacter arachoides]
MVEMISVAVVCHGALIRDAIIDTLVTDDISVAWSSDELGAPDASRSFVDVGIYVLGSGSEVHERQEAQHLLGFDVGNWIVLCDDKQNALCRTLLARDLPLAVAPIDLSRSDLRELVRLAARNRRLCVDSMCDRCPATIVNPLADVSLSTSQIQMMRYLAEGLSNKEIARIDHCSESLIKVRLRSLLEKLAVRNRTQAAVLAARSGLISGSREPGKKIGRPTLVNKR